MIFYRISTEPKINKYLIIFVLVIIIFSWLYFIFKIPEEPTDISTYNLNIPKTDIIFYLRCNLTEIDYGRNPKNYFIESDVLSNCYLWYESKNYDSLGIDFKNTVSSPSKSKIEFIDDNFNKTNTGHSIFQEGIRYFIYPNGSISLDESGYYKGEYTIVIYKACSKSDCSNKRSPPYSLHYFFRVYSLEEIDNIKMTGNQVNATILAAIISAFAVIVMGLFSFMHIDYINKKNTNKFL